MVKRTLNAAARASLPGSFVRLERGFVHYELSGPEGGPVIALVPGLSVPYSTWDRTAPYLASRGFRVLRYDHFGRGYSDRPRGEYGLDLFVEQLLTLPDALGLPKPLFLVGLSMGGPVAAEAATREAGFSRAVALVAPLFEWNASSVPDRFLPSAQRGDFHSEAAFREFYPSYLAPLRYKGVARAVMATVRGLGSWPLRRIFEDLGRSGLPTLLFWGREDATLPFEQGTRLRGLLPNGEFRAIEGAGHVPHWEKPDEVNREIIEFFAKLRLICPATIDRMKEI